ncbi:MAG: hypothetical protein HOV81_01345, partial [Kofleriaceae bacterium]|nr:hypothetical protein [Kofleriaceae bacterium]
PDLDEPNIELDPTDLPAGADSGLLLHDLFEHVELQTLRDAATAEAWHADPEIAQLVADKARERGIAEVYLPHAARVVHATLTQPLALVDGSTLPPLVDATAFARELEFTYPIPGGATAQPKGLVKGFIDVLCAYGDDLWVLDYKSDLLLGPDFATAAKARAKEHYSIQARLYALAADKLRGGRRFAGLLFAFVRYGVVVPMPVDDSHLAQWSTWLANLRTEIPR